MIITTSGLWTTLKTTKKDNELSIWAKCDVCLILVSKGNTGFRQVIKVTPHKSLKTSAKHKRTQPKVGLTLQQAVSAETTSSKEPVKRKARKTPSLSSLNILPDTGRPHNTRKSNGTQTRHTSRELRKTYRDVNYKDLDVKEEKDSPPRK